MVGGSLVVEVRERLPLGDDQHVEPAVVVEVADSQAASQTRDRPGVACSSGDVDEPSPIRAQKELGGHEVGDMRPQIVDVAVRCGQVELAVVVDVQEAGSKTEHIAACRGQPHRGSAVDELAASKVPVEGCRFPDKNW